MQVKLFCSTSMEQIESEVNKFLGTKPEHITITDIRINTCSAIDKTENNVILITVIYEQKFKPLKCDRCDNEQRKLNVYRTNYAFREPPKEIALCDTCYKKATNVES